MSGCISTWLIGLPRIRALPAVGKISRISSLIVVDLTAPFGPINPNPSPVSTCMFNPSSEVFFLRCRNPKRYSLVRFSISIAKPGMYSLLACPARPSIVQLEGVRGEKIQRRVRGRNIHVKSGVAAGLPDLHQFRGGSSRRSEEHTSELQSRQYLVCRLLLEKKKTTLR